MVESSIGEGEREPPVGSPIDLTDEARWLFRLFIIVGGEARFAFSGLFEGMIKAQTGHKGFSFGLRAVVLPVGS